MESILSTNWHKAQKRKYVANRRKGAKNFINILRAHFSYKSELSSFSLLRDWLWTNFCTKNARVKWWWNWHLFCKHLSWNFSIWLRLLLLLLYFGAYECQKVWTKKINFQNFQHKSCSYNVGDIDSWTYVCGSPHKLI